MKNPDYPSGLVIMTHRHHDFECLSPRDYVDTKSWLAYEQNPYSTHWVRTGSCHGDTSLVYDILPPITQLRANMNIRLLQATTAPRCSELGSCATLPQLVQPWVLVSSWAWLSSIVASMTQRQHHIVAKSLRQHHCGMTRQLCRQHDSASTSCHGQVASAVPL
jgi:hypothetical protein